MEDTTKTLASLIAGALISVLVTLLFQLPLLDVNLGILILILPVIFLLLLAFGMISEMRHKFNLWKRKGNKLFVPKIGILNDMGWDVNNKQIFTWTHVSPEEWKNEIERQAKNNKVKIKVELINVGKNFDPYFAILNPYGGVYPERDLKNFETMNKILNYVRDGGLFVNVADIPCYWAYKPLLERRLDTTPAIYGIERTPDGKILITPVRPFKLTPLMENLGLIVFFPKEDINDPEDDEHPYPWINVEFEEGFNEIMEIDEIKVNRVVVVEKNVEPIIKPKDNFYREDKATPLFFVKYGDEGNFLISLIFEPQDNMMKEGLAKIIIKLIGEKNKKN